ncbi:3-oxoadipate--succinyl-CoA transferase subunit A [Acrocarpospora corrugata]|uniref:3-oxoadipate--succinyl-CoA transferase subunit A n=1 Tax=Acrocarpospora corrugata TaxID=35763 RepID=A0A5M3VWQ4_9ACTN|nr:CoA-transferase [Acrocarpospora corrugata]GER99190.1 3-oxoadipate--succinyl-CoA transferase subunit A [Acrocarpospora corrugata]
MTANKVTTPEEAVADIPDGAVIALGGVHSHNSPMALVNALIRRGVRDLELIPTPSAGAPVDMLIAAGCVRRLHVSYVGLEFLGLAPNYRRAAENQTIDIVEGDEAYIVYGFRAGASRLPFLPLPPLYEGTDLPKVNPAIRTTTDPYTGRTVTTVPALRADYGLFHAQVTDQKGNAQIFGQRRFEDVMAKACDHVVISSDEILDEYAPAPDPRLVSIPGAIVDRVAHAPFGAYPLSSPGHYGYDRDRLVEYRDLAAQDRTKEYLETFVHSVADHQEHLEKIGTRRLLALRQTFR